MRKIIIFIIFILFWLFIWINNWSAAVVEQLTTKLSDSMCTWALVNRVYYLTWSTVDKYLIDEMWSSTDRYIASSTSKISFWESSSNLVTWCRTSTDWYRQSEVAPWNNIRVVAYWANCTFHRPTSNSNRTLQFVYNIDHWRITTNWTTTRTKNYSTYSNWTWNFLSKNYTNYYVQDYEMHASECFNVELQYCWDWVLDSTHWEACDDGNNIDWDGCSATCQLISPSIQIDKIDANPADLDWIIWNDTQTVNVSSGAVFRIRVTNNFTEDLTNLVLTDAVAPNCAWNVTLPTTFPSTWTGVTVGWSWSHTNATLEVGEYIDYTCDRSNTTAWYTNSAIVTWRWLVSNQSVTDTDTTVVLTPTISWPTCWTAWGYAFSYSETVWPATITFCSSGATVNPNPPTFPSQNWSTSWTCSGTWSTVTCNASRWWPGSSSCFPAWTKISMSDGTYKNIEEVKVWDEVLSYNEKLWINEFSKVQELEAPIRDHMCYLNFTDWSKLELTQEHPVYTIDWWKSINPEDTLKENSLLKAKKLVEWDLIKTNNWFLKLDTISCQSKNIQTYNLKKVENNYTFYADNILVHNKWWSGPSCTKISIPALEASWAWKAMSSTWSVAISCYWDSRAMVIWIDCDLDWNGSTKSITYQSNSTLGWGWRVSNFTCTYNNLNTVPHPKCYVTSWGWTVTTNSTSSLACSTWLSVWSNSCWDWVIQRPNDNHQMEVCEKSINAVTWNLEFPSWCTNNCQTLNFTYPWEWQWILTFPWNGNIIFRPFWSVIIWAWSNPFSYTTQPYISNDSSEDLYLDYPLCVHSSNSSVLLRSNWLWLDKVCTSNNIWWMYPGVTKTYESLNWWTPVNVTWVRITGSENYRDTILKITLWDLKDAFFAAVFNVRVSKPAIATVWWWTSLIKNSNITADVNKVAWNWYSDPNKNKNFVWAWVSTWSLSSYTKIVDNTNSVNKVTSQTKTETNLTKVTTNQNTWNKNITDSLTKYNWLSNVFIVKTWDLTINSSISWSWARTYIVEWGDLYISQNITYTDNIAFVVKWWNIIINSSVTNINGTFISIKVDWNWWKITSSVTDNKLVVNWSLYADISILVANRTHIENKNDMINVWTVVSFGSNLFRKQAPLVWDFIWEYIASKKVAK